MQVKSAGAGGKAPGGLRRTAGVGMADLLPALSSPLQRPQPRLSWDAAAADGEASAAVRPPWRLQPPELPGPPDFGFRRQRGRVVKKKSRKRGGRPGGR